MRAATPAVLLEGPSAKPNVKFKSCSVFRALSVSPALRLSCLHLFVERIVSSCPGSARAVRLFPSASPCSSCSPLRIFSKPS